MVVEEALRRIRVKQWVQWAVLCFGLQCWAFTRVGRTLTGAGRCEGGTGHVGLARNLAQGARALRVTALSSRG